GRLLRLQDGLTTPSGSHDVRAVGVAVGALARGPVRFRTEVDRAEDLRGRLRVVDAPDQVGAVGDDAVVGADVVVVEGRGVLDVDDELALLVEHPDGDRGAFGAG